MFQLKTEFNYFMAFEKTYIIPTKIAPRIKNEEAITDVEIDAVLTILYSKQSWSCSMCIISLSRYWSSYICHINFLGKLNYHEDSIL